MGRGSYGIEIREAPEEDDVSVCEDLLSKVLGVNMRSFRDNPGSDSDPALFPIW